MKYLKQTVALIIGGLCLPLFAQQTGDHIYDEEVSSKAKVHATISNLGLIGNAFRGSFNTSNQPSCEYPPGSGIEHVFQGGLWIGGMKNGQIQVSTGAQDDVSGYTPGKAGFEFSSRSPLTHLSNQSTSPHFSSDAVSAQDFVSVFSDTALVIRVDSMDIPINSHLLPLGLSVSFSSYNWASSLVDDFLILRFRIHHIDTVPIDSLYIGYWADGVVRNVNISPPAGAAFFNKGGNGFIDSLDLAYEFDATGDVGFTDSYVGIKYLGSELNGMCPSSPNFDTHFNTWQFQNSSSPLYFFPNNDLQRYDKMTLGLNNLNSGTWSDIQNQIKFPNNRSNLLSVGPFTRLAPGDSIDISFAMICARRVDDGLPASENTSTQRGNLIQHAKAAQQLYTGEDLNRNCQLDPGEDLNGDGQITRYDPAYVTSLEEHTANVFEIQPNPVRGTLFVKTDSRLMSMRLIDLQGRVIELDWTNSGQEYVADVSFLPQGMYVLDLQSQESHSYVNLLLF